MYLINKAHAMPPPDAWPENMVECAIHGKIVYQWKISEAECENYWLTIVRDETYTYYNVVTATPKDFYQMFHESPDGKGPVTVTHEACPPSSKIPLNNEDYYHFTIRKHYVYDNFAIETDTGSTDAWKKLPSCSWNIIDQAPLNTQGTWEKKAEALQDGKSHEISYGYIGLIFILGFLTCFGALYFKKSKLKK